MIATEVRPRDPLVARLRVAGVVAALLSPVLLLAVWKQNADSPGGPAEFFLFGSAGRQLLTGHWNEVLDRPQVQAGPLELAPYGLADLLAPQSVLAWTFVSAVLVVVLLVGILVAVGPLVHPDGAHVRALLPVAVLLLLLGLLPWAFHSGHPAQVVIPVLWIVAARCAEQRRFLAVGIAIGLAAGWEVWGVLGMPVVLMATRPDLRRAAAGGVLVLAVLYGPFALLGHLEMFSFAWGVSSDSLVGMLAPDLQTFPWGMRLLQALFAIGTGAFVALLSRGSAYGSCLVVLAVLGARLVLDPLLFNYYWIAPATMAVLVLAVAVARRRPWELLAAGTLLAMLFLGPVRGAAGSIVLLVSVLAVGASIRIAAGRRALAPCR